MWNAVLDKLARLRGIDRQFQAFGADTHRYRLNPPLKPKQLVAVERTLGIALPEQLRNFYLNVGDGGAGPHYGLRRAAELDGFRPAEAYPGIEHIREHADQPVNGDGYFEVPHEVLAGLLAIIDEGCGHRLCLVTSGTSVGRLVDVSNDGFVVERDEDLVGLYGKWFDRELTWFDAVRRLMLAGATFEQIQSELAEKHQCHNAGDRIASIADVKKPEALFGPGGRGIYHGATQFPWYKHVLREWQAKHT